MVVGYDISKRNNWGQIKPIDRVEYLVIDIQINSTWGQFNGGM